MSRKPRTRRVHLSPPPASQAGAGMVMHDGRIRASEHPPGDDHWGDLFDRLTHAFQARLTLAVSPLELAVAFFDWGMHLANAPGRQSDLAGMAIQQWARLGSYLLQSATDDTAPPCIEAPPQDHRFTDESWQKPPFAAIRQAFLLQQQWWHAATTGIRGVAPRHERTVAFVVRQWLDFASPSNFFPTNPDVLQTTVAEGGQNLLRGAQYLAEDIAARFLGRESREAGIHEVGRTVAVTPGKVVFRNALIELIQYTPTTATVLAEPVLIVPAWIMKYYILDLSPGNSLVRYLVDQGCTVFMISWRNPRSDDRDLGMEDYRRLGVDAALSAIGAICPGRRVHACGYCLGGTLLTIAAAALARDRDDRLKTITLFAAETDFSEAGELTLFLGDSQIAFLEDTMWEQGYLDAHQMAGAFQLLRSNDLIWSQAVRQYLQGERTPMNDLMAWNADATRMPARMHSEYLRHLFIENELAEGQYRVDGRPVALSDIRVPLFVVATRTDHVAPWHSVFKIHLLTETALRFVLTSGGHNAGIVSEPGHPGRHYQMMERPRDAHYVDPETWLACAPTHEGSWWPAWVAWLREASSDGAAPPPMGGTQGGDAAYADAPGLYVLEH